MTVAGIINYSKEVAGGGSLCTVGNSAVSSGFNIGDVTVTEADADEILNNVAALDEAIFNANVKAALATAKATFEANKTLDNYNALNNALIEAQESVNLYKKLDEAISNIETWSEDTRTDVAASYRSDYTNGVYEDSYTVEDIYTNYQFDQIQALAADANATDYTSVILNPSFETGDLTGWNANKSNDTGVKKSNNATYSFSNSDDANIFNSWGGSNELFIKQTIENLPEGTYKLSAVLAGFKGESLVLSANNVSKTLVVEENKAVGYETFVIFKLTKAGNVTIKASNTKSQSTSDASFIKCDNFRLMWMHSPSWLRQKPLTRMLLISRQMLLQRLMH